MKTHLRLIAIAIAGLSLAACANRPPPSEIVWTATPDASISKDQALAKCRYDLMQPMNRQANFDHLFLYSGQPLQTPTGHIQGLSANRQMMFVQCMRSHGFQPGGTVQVQMPGAAP